MEDVVYLGTNSDRVYCIHMAKLMDKAPNSWIAKAILGRAPGDASGTTQERPLFLPVPGWFVRAVADWCMPLSTGCVFFEHPHDGVVEVLTAMGWPAADGGDLPVHMPATVVPTAVDADGRSLLEMINDHMPNKVAKACGYMSGVWRFRYAVVLSSSPQNEVVEANRTISLLPKQCFDTMTRLMPGKFGDTHTIVVNCSNGAYVVSVTCAHVNKITITAFY